MITTASMEQAFDECNLTIDQSAIAQFTEVANEMGYSASDMAEKWDVYSMNNAISEPANVKGLLSLKPSLVAKRHKPTTTSRRHTNKENYTHRTPVAIRKKSKSAYMTQENDLSSPGLMNKRVKFQSPSTPAALERVKSLFSPTTLSASSPLAGMTYDQRPAAGQVVHEFNPEMKKKTKYASRVHVHPVMDVNTSVDFSYMHTPLTERAKVLEKQLVEYQTRIEDHYDLSECGVIGEPSPVPVVVVGRICCDAAEGKLNTDVVMLEGSRASCGGQRVSLDLSSLSVYNVFPGKIVALEGVYPSINTPFYVKRVLDPVTAPMPKTKASELTHSSSEPVRVLVASGPFTCNDNTNYMPLHDLIEIAKVDRPNVVILVGPFIDATHQSFKDGAVEYEGMTVNFMDIFLFKVVVQLEKLLDDNHELQIVMIPSLKDVHHDYVFPQPPFDHKKIYEVISHPKRLHLLSNPATFTINEVVFGVCGIDVLFQLGSTELNRGSSTPRLMRLAQQVIEQKSFYPIFPPASSGNAPLDIRYMKQYQFGETTPDILILPSVLNRFCSVVDKTVCLNPGQLAKGNSGGTFAGITIMPFVKRENPDEEMKGDPADEELLHDLPARAFVEIKRI